MAPTTYRYVIAFPRRFDGTRPDWPIDVLEEIAGLPGYVDALLPEFNAAWHPPTEEGVRRESRRQVIFLDVTSATPAAAAKTHDAVRALVRELKTQMKVVEPVTVTRWQVDTEMV